MKKNNLLLYLPGLILVITISGNCDNPVNADNDPAKAKCKVDFYTDSAKGTVSRLVYDQMIEHAYWSIHLGLWTQMLDNGSFELDRKYNLF